MRNHTPQQDGRLAWKAMGTSTARVLSVVLSWIAGRHTNHGSAPAFQSSWPIITHGHSSSCNMHCCNPNYVYKTLTLLYPTKDCPHRTIYASAEALSTDCFQVSYQYSVWLLAKQELWKSLGRAIEGISLSIEVGLDGAGAPGCHGFKSQNLLKIPTWICHIFSTCRKVLQLWNISLQRGLAGWQFCQSPRCKLLLISSMMALTKEILHPQIIN